jgi:hypothetical protein
MIVTIEHDIDDAADFQARAERAMPPPDGLQVHLLSLEGRGFVDGALGHSSTQRYFAIAEDHALGLPVRQHA